MNRPQASRVIALPPARIGAHSSRNKNETGEQKHGPTQALLASLWLTVPAVWAGLGKAQDMSWLGGNWYGVIAFFGIPAALGILCWTGVHYLISARHRHERAREARHRPF